MRLRHSENEADIKELKKRIPEERVNYVRRMIPRHGLDYIEYYVKELRLTEEEKRSLRPEAVERIDMELKSRKPKPNKYMEIVMAIDLFKVDPGKVRIEADQRMVSELGLEVDRSMATTLGAVLAGAARRLRKQGDRGQAEIVERCLEQHGIQV